MPVTKFLKWEQKKTSSGTVPHNIMSQKWSQTCRRACMLQRISSRSTALNYRTIATSTPCKAKRSQSLAEADSRPVKAVRQMEFQSYSLNPYPRLATPPATAPLTSISSIKHKWETTLETAQKADQTVTLTGKLSAYLPMFSSTYSTCIFLGCN
jgi:hypothetical protein